MNISTKRILSFLLFFPISLSGFALFGFKKHKKNVYEEKKIDTTIITPILTQPKYPLICKHYSDNPTVDSLLCFAFTNIGKPYGSGCTGPNSFDCSGFTSYVYSKFGYKLNRSSGSQTSNGVEVGKDQLAPGDLVFFKGRNAKADRIGHVGIIATVNDDGTFTFIHSANGTGISHDNSTAPYYTKRYVTACRVISLDGFVSRTRIKETDEIKDSRTDDLTPDEQLPPPAEYKRKLKRVKVKKGESLYSIADDYDCSVKDLKSWNNLKSNQIQVGQKLLIHLSSDDKKNTPKATAKNQKPDIDVDTDETASVDNQAKVAEHIVEKGESLHLLSKQYNCSIDDLKKWNNLDGNKVMIGQKLVIRPSNNETVAEVKPEKKAVKEEDDEVSLAKSELQSIDKQQSNEHVVEKGETLFGIAMKYGCSVNDLRAWNNLDKSTVYPSQKLIIKGENGQKASPVYHVVSRGESLYSIAESYQTNIKTIQDINQLESTDIKAGQRLRVK